MRFHGGAVQKREDGYTRLLRHGPARVEKFTKEGRKKQSSENIGLFEASSCEASWADWECLAEERNQITAQPKWYVEVGLVLP